MTDIAAIEMTPVLAVLIAAVATYASRFIGVLFSGRIRVEDPVFEWVTAVAYALLAGLVVRMILIPIGTLESVDVTVRAGAGLVALVVFFVTRRNLLLGVLAGVLTLTALASI